MWKFWISPGYLKYYSFDVTNTWKPLIPFNLKFTNEDKGTSTYYISKNSILTLPHCQSTHTKWEPLATHPPLHPPPPQVFWKKRKTLPETKFSWTFAPTLLRRKALTLSLLQKFSVLLGSLPLNAQAYLIRKTFLPTLHVRLLTFREEVRLREANAQYCRVLIYKALLWERTWYCHWSKTIYSYLVQIEYLCKI